MRHLLSCALLVAPLYLMAHAHAAPGPDNPVCIAPSDPGGGWDFTCRSVAKVMTQLGLAKGSVQTLNMAGAGGGVAYAHVVSKRPTDANIFVAASTATPARLAQRQFPGLSVDQVNWIGTVGADYGIIAVPKDSPYQDLTALIDRLRQDPRSVSFAGGSAMGGWDHLKVLMTARAGGIDAVSRIKYLSYNNAGDAAVQVAGHHVDAFTGNISQALGFYQSGDFRILAVLSEQRLPDALATIPTATEQGIDVVAPTWRGFYAPGGITPQERDWWVRTLDTINRSEEWHAVMQQNGLMPFFKTGDEFEAFVRTQIEDISALSQEIGLLK